MRIDPDAPATCQECKHQQPQESGVQRCNACGVIGRLSVPLLPEVVPSGLGLPEGLDPQDRRMLETAERYYGKGPDPWGFTGHETYADVERLRTSPDVFDRIRAKALTHRLHFAIVLPEGTWCVTSVYLDGWSRNVPIWSAHATKEQAEAFLPAWKDWAVRIGRGPETRGYGMQVEQRDDAQPFHLVHPLADRSIVDRKDPHGRR